MNISIHQSLSLAASAAAFSVLDYSDRLNDLTSRITGGRINRNTLAEGVLQQATNLALDIARQQKSVDTFARENMGILGGELVSHADRILCGPDQDAFSNSVDELLEQTLRTQVEKGNIQSGDITPARDLVKNLVNDRVGKQVIHQFLGSYVQNHSWEHLTTKIQSAVVQENDFSFKNLLVMAGVRVASGFAHSLINRGIVENQSFAGLEVKPEIKLAADCLNAYLTNDFNCEEALKNYKPSTGLIDEALISNVADLTPTLIKHYVNSTQKALDKASVAFEVENAKFEKERAKGAEALQEPAEDSQATRPAEISLRNDATEIEDDWVTMGDEQHDNQVSLVKSDHADAKTAAPEDEEWLIMSETQHDIRVVSPNADGTFSKVSDGDEDGVHDFLLVEPEALTEARARLKKAGKNHDKAKQMHEMSVALKDLLVTDPTRKNDERLGSALKTVIKSLTGGAYDTTTLLAGKTLSAGEGLPAQNIIGTYVAEHGWKELEAIIGKAVDKHLENMRQTSMEKRAQAIKDGEQPDGGPSWADEAIPKLAAKLAIQHLKPYIGEAGGKFDQRTDPTYKAAVELIHANQDSLVKGDMSLMGLVRRSMPILTNYASTQVSNAAQHVGAQVMSQAEQLTSAVSDYATNAAHAGAIVGTAMQEVGNQVLEDGLIATIAGGAVDVTTATAGYATGVLSTAAKTTMGWFGSVLPSWGSDTNVGYA